MRYVGGGGSLPRLSRSVGMDLKGKNNFLSKPSERNQAGLARSGRGKALLSTKQPPPRDPTLCKKLFPRLVLCWAVGSPPPGAQCLALGTLSPTYLIMCDLPGQLLTAAKAPLCLFWASIKDEVGRAGSSGTAEAGFSPGRDRKTQPRRKRASGITADLSLRGFSSKGVNKLMGL